MNTTEIHAHLELSIVAKVSPRKLLDLLETGIKMQLEKEGLIVAEIHLIETSKDSVL